MLAWLLERPGRLFVLATLLPLVATALTLLAGLIRGRRFPRLGPTLGTTAIVLSCVLSLIGLHFFYDRISYLQCAQSVGISTLPTADQLWSERVPWVALRLAPLPAEEGEPPPPRPAIALELGYRIDAVTVLMFSMVTFVAMLIHIFSLGYLASENNEQVEDHEVHTTNGHLHRRGRMSRFFMYLSLFCFSMLNLLIADNLFQVFVSWELVGVCSFFLIGFYYERPSAALAANKAFIVNRVGDAGFLLGLAVLWTYVGTLNFTELEHRLRSPAVDAHGSLELAGQFVRVSPSGKPTSEGVQTMKLPPRDDPPGSHLAIFPIHLPANAHFHGLGYAKTNDREFDLAPGGSLHDFSAMPYWLFVLAGLGLFLGCVGKSAQFPLHTWLPDAMEGPTPVSALIHAATMVAAGVYLTARCAVLFAPEVLLTVAYTGALTLLLAASIALVMTDIKRVLAYSTVSQLGYMMLAIGTGGWVAGQLHLLTHAFFKALLFLAAGSVIHGLHHQQDLLKMGGLIRKMPVTAWTMLVGVLAIAGTPLFSGWYSKDQILVNSLGYAMTYPQHWLLFAAPLLGAGMTAFYMFRLWFLAFVGQPRDPHLYEQAHESPWVMTGPLVVLAIFSVCVAWDWRNFDLLNAEASTLGACLISTEPHILHKQFHAVHEAGHSVHLLAGSLALLAALIGAGIAAGMYWLHTLPSEMVQAAYPLEYGVLSRKWGFDELYDRLLVQPVLGLAYWVRLRDKCSDDPPLLGGPPTEPHPTATLDGVASLPAHAVYSIGVSTHAVQVGSIRRYVLGLALTALAIFAILAVLGARP